ncbi:MAG: hypothetical protein K0R93_103 [Anaerosolibacter sp.]|jgi:uncharacterized HAD superfamily protein|uniref:5' nucleotidase, NT5C type n=1 Tax=Anaerosolibacter sp. TaxID=1872527 RepID=UPI002628B450|nr:hypothetical protein [Anaerosolibacter sp.]MDF2545205.1 hypothetical protein [Anaerosolibacter sp.]
MKLNLCIDIDGTITGAYYWLDIANRYFKTNIKPSEVKVYDIHEVLKIPREAYLKFYEMYGEEIHAQADLRQNAKEILWKLNQKHNIYYITAREKTLEEVTKGWFHRNELPQGELHLLGSHYKVNQAKELGCDIFIEDRYENAIQLALAGFEVLLMDCNYNRLPLIPGITRVYDWKEIHKVIEEYIAGSNEKSTKIA